MVSGNDLNTFFTVYGPTISGIGEICGILGFIGSGVLWLVNRRLKKKVDNAENRIEKCEIMINSIKAYNAQIAETINNYGLSLADTKVAAADVFNEKAKNKPDIYMGEEEPEELSKGMIWPTGE